MTNVNQASDEHSGCEGDEQPTVEVGVYFDADGEMTDLMVFVNGRQYPTRLEIARMPANDERVALSRWRKEAWEASRLASMRFMDLMNGHFLAAEQVHTTNDLRTPPNVQPDVTLIAELDPTLWSDAATTNNAWRAARGALAVKAFGKRPTGETYADLRVAVATYRLAFNMTAAPLAEVLQDLLTDVRHFAAARGGTPENLPCPGCDPDQIGLTTTVLAQGLDALCCEDWEDKLDGVSFDEVERAAFDRYLEEATGTA